MPDRLVHDLAAALLAAGVNPHGMTVIEAALALESFIRTDRDAAVEAARQEERQLCIAIVEEIAQAWRDTGDPETWPSCVCDDIVAELRERPAGPVPEEETQP